MFLISFIQKQKLKPIIEKICEGRKEGETIEVQIKLKGYDYKKDVRFDTNVVLPYPKRKSERILVFGDALQEKAKELGCDFMSNSELEGKNKEKEKIKKKIAMKYHSFISIPAFNTIFEMKIFNRKKKPIHIVKNPADLPNFYKEIQRTVKFKLRKTCDLAFTIGYVGMDLEEIMSNFNTGIQGLIAVLKKGSKNLGNIYMKSCQGESVRVY